MSWFSDKTFHVKKEYALRFSAEVKQASDAYEAYVFDSDVTLPGPFIASPYLADGKHKWWKVYWRCRKTT